MSVNLLHCDLSAWRGDGELCRWCNLATPRGGRKFCSRECMTAFYDNHSYPRGKQLVLVWNQQPCGCPDNVTGLGAYNLGPPTWRVVYLKVGPKPHVLCAACGECEEQIAQREDRLTVNHIRPRMGIPCNVLDCIHHMENLEPLCWRCHEALNKLGNVRPRLDEWVMVHT